jgi:hypothetical protein
MSNANNTWLGSSNSASPANETAQRALFLKVFAGEVITAFKKHTIMLDKHNVRTIKAGKSAQFPVIGRMPDAEYHTPGAEILGQDVLHGERTINIDRLLISHVFIDDLDEAMAHFEVRSKYSDMMGQKLAETFDNHVMREVLLGAAASATVTGLDGGKAISDDDLKSGTAATKWTGWEDALFQSAQNFDDKFVVGPRYCVLKPVDYYFLVRHMGTNGMSMIQRDVGGEGSYADGNLIKVGGIKLISSPMLPTSNYSAEDYHAVNASLVKAICFTPDAIGTVKLLDVAIQTQWDIRRQGNLTVARYAMGHAYLQPECCVKVATAT